MLTLYTDNTPPSAPSRYLIEVITPSGCTSTRAVSHNTTRSNRQTTGIGSGTGIAETANIDVTLFPNPTDGLIQVMFRYDGKNNAAAYLTDLAGRQVSERLNVANGEINMQFDLSALERGLYLLRVEGEVVDHTERIIKQ